MTRAKKTTDIALYTSQLLSTGRLAQLIDMTQNALQRNGRARDAIMKRCLGKLEGETGVSICLLNDPDFPEMEVRVNIRRDMPQEFPLHGHGARVAAFVLRPGDDQVVHNVFLPNENGDRELSQYEFDTTNGVVAYGQAAIATQQYQLAKTYELQCPGDGLYVLDDPRVVHENLAAAHSMTVVVRQYDQPQGIAAAPLLGKSELSANLVHRLLCDVMAEVGITISGDVPIKDRFSISSDDRAISPVL